MILLIAVVVLYYYYYYYYYIYSTLHGKHNYDMLIVDECQVN
jgi:hypothetical protein